MAIPHDDHGHDAHSALATQGSHGAHGAHHSVREDRVPAYIGLIAGGIFIFTVLFTVVHLTNAHLAGRTEHPAAAAAH